MILYEGPSLLNDEPIVVIATLTSANKKTGDMIQTWILNQDIDPVTALKEGKDVSICGVCPLRQSVGGCCYVNVGQAPLAVYRAYKAGRYASVDQGVWASGVFKHRKVRLGSYGDPAAVPVSIWLALTSWCNGHTGYTHQMAHPAFDERLLDICMASVETPKMYDKVHEDYPQAKTFRVIASDAPLKENERECPSHMGIQCRDCMVCSGIWAPTDVVVKVHGSRKRRFL